MRPPTAKLQDGSVKMTAAFPHQHLLTGEVYCSCPELRVWKGLLSRQNEILLSGNGVGRQAAASQICKPARLKSDEVLLRIAFSGLFSFAGCCVKVDRINGSELVKDQNLGLLL